MYTSTINVNNKCNAVYLFIIFIPMYGSSSISRAFFYKFFFPQIIEIQQNISLHFLCLQTKYPKIRKAIKKCYSGLTHTQSKYNLPVQSTSSIIKEICEGVRNVKLPCQMVFARPQMCVFAVLRY